MSRVDRDRPDSLSVPEMLRIMDVATTLRQDREVVEEQLNFEALKARLKERMLAASKVTGEEVTPEEVDAAINQYYASLYTFREPKPSFLVALAHLWVRRVLVLWGGSGAIVSVGLLWWLYLSPNAAWTARGRLHRQVEALAAEVSTRAVEVQKIAKDESVAPEVARLSAQVAGFRQKNDAQGLESVRHSLDALEKRIREVERLSSEIAVRSDTVKAIALDRTVAPEVARLISEAEVYRKKDDPQGLESVRDVLARLEGKLREEYAITVVTVEVKGRKQNAILRYAPKNEGGQVSGYYLFVQARRADGTVIPERIRNAEKDVYEEVTTWAERVPEAVFERLKKDKQADGILNETAFGMKKRGFLEEEITMPGGDGKPLTRMGQITKW